MEGDVELAAGGRQQRGPSAAASAAAAPHLPPSPRPPGPPPSPLLRGALGPHTQLPQLPPGVAIPLLREPSESSQLSGASGLGAHALRDTSELIDAACGLPPLREEERRRVMASLLDGGEEALLQRLRFRLDRAGIAIPYQRVCYKGLTVTRRAVVGASAAVPTIGSVLRDAARAVAGRRRGDAITALDGATGVLRPRTMTLLLGPPGSGKTTLLRALTGRLAPDRYTRIEGEVTHNGHALRDLVVQRSSSYVDQVDQHLSTLTVRETLKFAERCLGGSAVAEDLVRGLVEWEAANGVERTKEDEQADALFAHLVVSHHLLMSDYMMEVFGLSRAADTLVGDAMVRGISGGERRRVTTAEMLVGPAQVIALDAISNGLDSAVTLEIMASMRRVAHTLESTVIASLLQPEPAVVALFDDVMLLSEGRVIWHGPAGKALAHFASLGFAHPPDLDAADFLQLVASPRDHGEITSRPASARGTAAAAAAAASGGGGGASGAGSISGLSFARRGSRADGLMTSDQLADKFWASETGQALMVEVEAPQEVPPDLDHARLFTSRYGAPWPTLLAACLSRAATLEWRRNWPAAVVRWLLALVISLVAGSIFWQLPATFEGAVSAMGMLFWVLCFVLVITVPTVEVTYHRRPVVMRQRANHFYAGWMEAVPQVLVNLPILLVDAIAIGTPVYWMVGFHPGAGRFLAFLAVLLGANLAADNFYRLLGAVMPNLNVGVALGVTIYIAMELLAGFTISPAAIPQPWRTVHYLNPLAYAYRAAALNELRSPRWTSQPAPAAFGGPPATLSDALVAFFELGGGGGSGAWVGIGLGVLLAFFAAYVVGSMLAFSLLKPPATKAVKLEEGGPPSAAAGGKGGAGAPAPERDDAFVLDAKALRAAAAADAALQEELAPPIEPVAVAFQDLRYFVPHPKKRGAELELLKGITGSFLPGKLVALMGSSGAGKTTLMDVIACRKTVGRIEGSLSANGAPLHASTFARRAGYVEQSDVHAPLATVGEALRLAARLRLPAAFTAAAREEMVVEVMRLVELDELEGALVGKPGTNGLSTEQRKRLTIGVELVTNPSVLFLDEPSSGLDSRSAAVVMNVVAAVAALGRTVVATIHQPSASIFSLFDELLLLQRGGALVYSGPAAGVVAHLAALPGAPAFEAGRNPASWMLDVVAALSPASGGGGGGVGSVEAKDSGGGAGVSLVRAYADSPLSRAAAARAAAVAAARPEASGGSAAAAAAAAARGDPAITGPRPGVWVQFGQLMRRNLLAYWRDPGHNISRYAITTALAVLIGTVEFGKGREDHLVDARSVQNAMGAMYMLAISLAFEAAYEAQSGMVQERAVYARERASFTYGPGPYLAAQALVEVPYLVPQGAVYTLVLYFLLGLAPTAGSFFFALLVVLASTGCMVLFAQALVHVAPDPYLASLGLSLIGGSLFNVMCGFMAPLPMLPPWWRWFYYLNPLAYCLYAITADQVGGVERLMPSPTEAGVSLPVREYVAAVFGIQRGGAGVFPGAWGAVGMLGALCAGYFAASYLALRFLRHYKR